MKIFFVKNRPQHRCFCCEYCKCFKNSFFYITAPVASCDSYTTVQQSQLACLFFDFAPPPVFDLDQKLIQNVAQIIFYYHTKNLNWMKTCFQFQNKFWKNISCFQFWWKTYTKRCTNNYVTSKDFLRLHFAVDQVLSIAGYDFENGRLSRKQKYLIKIMAVKMPILILFCFCLLCWLSSVSIVAASYLNYVGPFRWF